ncbi:fatty acid desaturase [Winogradskyella sp. 3972H.M.0a.05]|uniref:fatty acid desaturase family protein n=1 Tax=Winogradskyella sp. 3972H.M.0a.05 TaxID=2950277 RepID=UPI00339152DD
MVNVNNIEGIKFGDVTNFDGVSYQEFRKHLNPKYSMVWRDLSIGYVLFLSTIVCFAYLEAQISNVYTLILLALCFGIIAAFWLANIQLFIHEAAHYNIHPNKKTNDILANIFVGLIVGVNINAYRKTHWKHHLRLGNTDDTEHSYFEALSLWYIIKMLTGLHVLAVLKGRNKLENAQTSESLKQQKMALLYGALFNMIIIAFLVLNSLYFTALVWIITIGVFYPFFASIRQIMEHRDEKADKNVDFRQINHGKVSRLFREGVFSYFFGGAGFNRHLIHHWDPQISYTRLKEVEAFLEQTDACGTIIKASKTTYFKTFLTLIR